MDDFNIATLQGSKNEWCCYLIQILTPLVMDGYKSILNEAISICKQHQENEKYLMTFQNYISRVPKWNQTIIDSEVKRISEKSGCSYLEELITCVHIIQLKMITAMRVGQKQKKIRHCLENHKGYQLRSQVQNGDEKVNANFAENINQKMINKF